MRFKGTPNMSVIDMKTRKKLGEFDNNGILETDNEKLIIRLKAKFKVEESDNEDVSIEPKQIFTCKKCGEEFDNRGLFLAHCRQEKKNEK